MASYPLWESLRNSLRTYWEVLSLRLNILILSRFSEQHSWIPRVEARSTQYAGCSKTRMRVMTSSISFYQWISTSKTKEAAHAIVFRIEFSLLPIDHRTRILWVVRRHSLENLRSQAIGSSRVVLKDMHINTTMGMISIRVKLRIRLLLLLKAIRVSSFIQCNFVGLTCSLQE